MLHVAGGAPAAGADAGVVSAVRPDRCPARPPGTGGDNLATRVSRGAAWSFDTVVPMIVFQEVGWQCHCVGAWHACEVGTAYAVVR